MVRFDNGLVKSITFYYSSMINYTFHYILYIRFLGFIQMQNIVKFSIFKILILTRSFYISILCNRQLLYKTQTIYILHRYIIIKSPILYFDDRSK